MEKCIGQRRELCGTPYFNGSDVEWLKPIDSLSTIITTSHLVDNLGNRMS